MKGFSRLMEDRIYFFFLEFAGKVELDMLKIHLSHLENIITVGKEDIPSSSPEPPNRCRSQERTA